MSLTAPARPPQRRATVPVELRRWQRAALARLRASELRDFLTVATPGAGKTTFALRAALEHREGASGRRVVVVVPTQHLKHQWAEAAEGFGLYLEPEWSQRDGELPSDADGAVLTYQQIATSAAAVRAMGFGAFVILDEVHHAAETRSWGDALRSAFQGAARRLSLSGTPFRSDTNPIPFVRYEQDLAISDFEYGYGEALADANVVRPVYFPRVGGLMEWEASDGSYHAQTFDDALDRQRSAQRLRTALSLEGEWLPAVIERAHHQLLALRQDDPTAAGMVVATDQDHARGIAEVLEKRARVRPVIATSDDPDASGRIARFRETRAPWIVAVRMVSEGVDIPRLRVGVYATTTTTELFFRQVVGRFVRWSPGVTGRSAYLFLPDDPVLRRWVEAVREARRHCLEKRRNGIRRWEDELDPDADPREAAGESAEDEEGQLSLFAPISAVPLDEGGKPFETTRPWGDDVELDDDMAEALRDEARLAAEEALAVPARPTRRRRRKAPDTAGALIDPSTDSILASSTGKRGRKRELRMLNTSRARTLATAKRLTHAEVNAELNRRAGIRRVSEATEEQLARRLACAERWLRAK